MFPIHEAYPAAPGPALVIVSSAYGLTQELREVADGYAAAGYVVAVPEMFSRTLPGPLGQNEADRAAANKRVEEFDYDTGVEDVRAVVETMRARPECTGTVIVMGYCFGGRLAYFAATRRLNIAAAISFQGVGIGKHLAEADRVVVPMSMHFGAADRLVPLDEVAAIENAFRANPQIEIFRYPGADHGFIQHESPRFQPEGMRLAYERADRFLAGIRAQH